MTPAEVKELIELLRAQGVKRFKTQDLELELSDAVPVPVVSRETPEVVEKISEIKHRIEETASLLRLADQELVDRLFPETPEEQGEQGEESAQTEAV